MTEIEFTLDGETTRCPGGLTIAAAVFHAGRQRLRITPRASLPRSLFCGMGVCFDCVMEVDGRSGVRTCTTLVRPGMRVRTQHGAASLGGPR
jgi:D-hydroxyproline dehydrogenase subunit gamma